jgi:YD repeat-containing protein
MTMTGGRTTMTAASQTAVEYAYDAAHRLTSITQGMDIVAFTYDNANRRATLTYPNGIVATCGYSRDCLAGVSDLPTI